MVDSVVARIMVSPMAAKKNARKPEGNGDMNARKPRNFPSEDLVDTRPRKDLGGESLAASLGVDFSPALSVTEVNELEALVDVASPEQFQQGMARLLRRMMARGLKDIPAPKSIKEFQVLFDMFRKAEGIERADKQGGPVGGGFLPRVVGRRSLGTGDSGVTKEGSEVVTTVESSDVRETVVAEEVPDVDAADPLAGFEV